VIFEILADRVAVLFLQHGEVRHHRHHRLWVVAGARHQLQSVPVGLDFVFARNLRHNTGLGQAAELVDDRREDRGDAEEDVEDFRFRVRREDVSPLDVAGLVADDACQLVVGLHEVDETLVHVHESAERRERVDLAILDDLDRVRNVFACDLIPKVAGDALNVGVEQRIGFDHAAGDDLLILGLSERDLGLRRHRKNP